MGEAGKASRREEVEGWVGTTRIHRGPTKQEGGPRAETQGCWAAGASMSSEAPGDKLRGELFLYISDLSHPSFSL